MKDKDLTNINSNKTTHAPDAWSPEFEKEDPVWDLLSKASTQEPSDFFARNVLREARNTPQLGSKGLSLSGILSFISPSASPRKLVLSAVAACACALITFQMWPNSESSRSLAHTEPAPAAPALVEQPPTDLASFIIEESLIVAAEDPTVFSHDEVLAMIGF